MSLQAAEAVLWQPNWALLDEASDPTIKVRMYTSWGPMFPDESTVLYRNGRVAEFHNGEPDLEWIESVKFGR